MRSKLFTSESVTAGHPDKMADAISDAILDDLIRQDCNSRVACETLITTGHVHIAGEITTTGYCDIPKLVRERILKIGYNDSTIGFDGKTCGILVSIDKQSADIAAAVSKALEARQASEDYLDEQGAGDQGMMFGYACSETPERMPLPITLAHRLAERLHSVGRMVSMRELRPDGKTQVTVRYEGNRPVAIEHIVISTQHSVAIESPKDLEPDLIERVITPVLEKYDIEWKNAKIDINPSGQFIIGGPQADAGLTGRKIIVDTYGGMARHGGGAFSGKDPSKVDRSAAYAMRWIAKNIVAAGFAEKCELQVAYAIGKAHPVSFRVDTFGTAAVPEEQIEEAVWQVFDMRPAAIIRDLMLKRPIYEKTSTYGHFGRELPDFTWEVTDRVDDLRKAVRG